MTSLKLLRLHSRIIFATACAVLTATTARAQSLITQWNFGTSTTVAAPANSPAPTTGNGTAVSLGMTNNYTYTSGAKSGTNSVTSDDILPTAGTANASFTESLWRIRGGNVTGQPSGNTTGNLAVNGWNLSAPQYTQGVEFDVSTANFTNITVGFDWYSTTQGVRDLQEQYTLNGSTWINIGALQVATANDYFGGGSATEPTNTISFSGISGANNDPTFGVRLVSAFDPTYTGTGSPTYTAAALVNGSAVIYNNNSGNWRFGNITFDGSPSAVPEPGTTALLMGLTCLGLVWVARRCRQASPRQA